MTKDKPKFINDNIVPVDFRRTYDNNMVRYSLYVLYSRFVPDIRDGLKPVQRRIIYSMWNDVGCVSYGTKRKTANTLGQVIGKYHPHGDSGPLEAMKAMTNWFEIKEPLIIYDSNSGSLQGGPQAAPRYTESYLSQFSMECLLDDLIESSQVVDWQNTFDNHTMEPESLPVKVPLLLVNGCFGIAVGRKIEVPKHSLNDVIDTTIALMHNPNLQVALIPDSCQKCEVVDTDWFDIAKKGYGYFTERGITTIETTNKGNSIIHILSVPNLIFSDVVTDKIDELSKNGVINGIEDIQDHSTEEQLDIAIILKKGVDPNYIRQMLYNNTSLQESKRVNMEVIDGAKIKRVGYKEYIQRFIDYRRGVKFRLYNARLQKVNTRLHQIEIYLKILESDDVDNIIHMIRNQNSMEENVLINWLMNKLKITDLQAKFILRTKISELSKGHYANYKKEQKYLTEQVKNYTTIIQIPGMIDAEIEQELLAIKAKYGKPRQSILISEGIANNIPEGEFKIIITENNYIRKMHVNEPFRPFKNDHAKCMVIGDNTKDIVLFDNVGRAYSIPIYKISFTPKGSPGIDIKMIIKKLTSNIISAMYLPMIESYDKNQCKYFLVILTKTGLIKKIDLTDILTATSSGITYSKLLQGDEVCEVLIANYNSDIIVYSRNKALRISMDSIPYLKRTAMGNISIKTNDNPVEGMTVITPDTRELIVITDNGKFNRITESVLPRSERNRAGSSVIKLSKTDSIKSIFPYIPNTLIRITRYDEIVDILTDNILIGSTASYGEKLCKDNIIKAELLKIQ